DRATLGASDDPVSAAHRCASLHVALRTGNNLIHLSNSRSSPAEPASRNASPPRGVSRAVREGRRKRREALVRAPRTLRGSLAAIRRNTLRGVPRPSAGRSPLGAPPPHP